MNVKLLRRIKKHILEEPKRLFMADIVHKETNGPDFISYPKCGTVGCIAGWAVLLSDGMDVPTYEVSAPRAQNLLGLTADEANRLFFSYGPKQFVPAWESDGKPETAEVCAARIEHFIKTKGKE